VRTESSLEASAINERVKHAWREHPRRVVIPNSTDFPSKIALALQIVRAILDGQDINAVQALATRQRNLRA
jgi:hypothetical protein